MKLWVTLKEVALIAAEDTRTAHHLLSHFGIATPVTSYFEHNKLEKIENILQALSRGDVALISEAGIPGLSDPGYELVRAALEHSVRVVPVPGPSALTTALVASGLPTDQFVYLGFLPRQKSTRRKLLQSVANEPRTIIAYEAPHRICDALDDIAATLGDRPISVARELTKLYEEFFRGRVNEARTHFEEQEPRGEFTLVIAGWSAEPGIPDSTLDSSWDDARILEAVRGLLATGLARTEAVKRVAKASGRARREVYQLAIGN